VVRNIIDSSRGTVGRDVNRVDKMSL